LTAAAVAVIALGFAAGGALLRTGPTCTNVMDIAVALIAA
jgi:glycerate-2-kinase